MALILIVFGVLILVVAAAILLKDRARPVAQPASPGLRGGGDTVFDGRSDAPDVAAQQPDFGDLPQWAVDVVVQPQLTDLASKPASVYPEVLFDKDPQQFKQAMREVITAAGKTLPTASQWRLILSPAGTTRVMAGAGAGKSTALSLRVVFMHKYLGIPLERISVVTFTRASRADMINKLVRDMALFGVSLTDAEAKQIVRTFHSLLLCQAQDGELGTFFEHVGSSNGSADDGLSALNNKQLDYLRNVYSRLYQHNPNFRKSIGQILLEKLATPRLSQYTDAEALDRAIAVAEPRDRLITQAMTDAWLLKIKEIGLKDDVISWEPVAIKTSRAGGVWHANGRINVTGVPIVFGCNGIRDIANAPLDATRYPVKSFDEKRSLNSMANVRLKIIATISIEKYIYIEDGGDLDDLKLWSDWFYRQKMLESVSTFPAFSLRIPGDTVSMSIFECLYSIGSFIASMGLNVGLTAHDIADEFEHEHGPALETNLCRGVAEFWPAMNSDGVSTYDELFLTHSEVGYLRNMPPDRLLPMQHLLIDEFQDISGQIVKWIKSTHKVLSEHGAHPSLLVVGDDRQSVYGWRGSDPEYMLQFNDHFPGAALVTMAENFRSGQHIINTAELLVKHMVQTEEHQHGVAAGSAADHLGDCELCTGGDEEITKLVTELIDKEPDASIFILSRTNEGLVPFKPFDQNKNITRLTIHRSKGLEADYVIIKGDCSYTGSSPLKNAIYSRAGITASYDLAQADEAMRLSYVAITRARKKVWWFGEPAKEGGAFRYLAEAVTGGAWN